jgi:hypothetical protein
MSVQIPEVKRPSQEVLTKIQTLKGKKGMLVAIEPETGDWFFGENVLQALKKARKRYPTGTFYFVRVGYPSAHAHKGGMKR